MIPVSGWFILFTLLLGLILIGVVLYMDYANTDVNCRDSVILSANRVVLVLGTLMFGCSATLLYCMTQCGSRDSEWSLAYLIFMAVIGLILIVCGAIANDRAKKVSCNPVKTFSPVIWGIGIIVFIISVAGIFLKLTDKTIEQLEAEAESVELQVEEEERKAAVSEKKREIEQKKRELVERRNNARDRVSKAKKSQKNKSSRSSVVPSEEIEMRNMNIDRSSRQRSMSRETSVDRSFAGRPGYVRSPSPELSRTLSGSNMSDLAGQPNPMSINNFVPERARTNFSSRAGM